MHTQLQKLELSHDSDLFLFLNLLQSSWPCLNETQLGSQGSMYTNTVTLIQFGLKSV